MAFDLYQLIQIVYWICLATAFGGVLFVAIAAPVIFRVVRDANPVLPTVLSVNLEGQHGTLLAGTIVSQLLVTLARVQLVCGIGLAIAFIAQFFLIDLNGNNLTAMTIRLVLFIIAAGVVIYDRTVVWPNLQRFRQEYLDHADEPEIANPAKDQFDTEHRRSVTLLAVVLFLLLGMVLYSANISPAVSRPPPAEARAS